MPQADSSRIGNELQDVTVPGGQGVQVGEQNLQVNVFGGQATVYQGARQVSRSPYRHQVRHIFPGELLGREVELTELAGFCTDPRPEAPSYAWWQAPAWAGKSALMAYFVLHPPSRVRVVAFFITGRLVGQSDVAAFLEAVLPQLAEIAGLPLPDRLTTSNSQAWFGQFLEDAASTCQRAGDRLVLLVDGLDEDRGVTASPDGHSIAALLPTNPPPGVRVLVSGRPDPPVPSDVPTWHPLRTSAIVRRLEASPEARVIQGDAERELDHLLEGAPAERELLELVVAAGGGLSSQDLVELAGRPSRAVEKLLSTFTGRTFQSSPSYWGSEERPANYFLAHEELRALALRSVESARLTLHRDRLWAWANSYRQAGWPAHTPEYLLRGYPSLLHELGDTSRAVLLASDVPRLHRLIDLSGSSTAAITEIAAVHSLLCRADEPDLAAVFRLAVIRDGLLDRTSQIPVELPLAWAVVGDLRRAEALTRSLGAPEHPSLQEHPMVLLVRTLVGTGQLNAAWEIAAAIDDPVARVGAMTAVTTARAAAGDAQAVRLTVEHLLDEIENFARPANRVHSLAALIPPLVASGDRDGAREVVRMLESTPRSVSSATGSSWIADEVVEPLVVEALILIGDFDRVMEIATLQSSDSLREQIIVALAEAAARDPRVLAAIHAEEPADRAKPEPSWNLWKRWRGNAKLDPAQSQASQQLTGPVPADIHFERQVDQLAQMTRILSPTGPPDLVERVMEVAEATAGSGGGESRETADAFVGLAGALVGLGDLQPARRAAELAEKESRRLPPGGRFGVLLDLVEVLAAGGDSRQAAALLAVAEDAGNAAVSPLEKAHVQARLAHAEVALGERERARSRLIDAEAALRSAVAPGARVRVLVGLAHALVAGGEARRALQSIEMAATAFDRDEFADDFEGDDVLAEMVLAFARIGEVERAKALSESILGGVRRVASVCDSAQELVLMGDPDGARTMLAQLERPGWSPRPPVGHPNPSEARIAARTAKAWAMVGDTDRARLAAGMAEALLDASARIWASEVVVQERINVAIALHAADPARAYKQLEISDRWITPKVPEFDRNQMLEWLARGWAILGYGRWAQDRVAAITSVGWRSRTLAALVIAHVNGDRRHDAETAAAAIASLGEAGRVGLVQASLALGQLTAAEDAALAISMPDRQREALEAIVELPHLAESRTLTALALANLPYWKLLSTVMTAEPSAVVELADTVLAAGTSR